MQNSVLVSVILLSILISGCAGKMPQTAEEFRKVLPDAFMGKKEEFEVDRAYMDIAKTFQTMAPRCLDVKIKTTSQTYQSYQVIVAQYNPTVIVTKDKAELHVQKRHESGVMAVYKEPEKGHYLIVADVTPLGKNRSKIVMYRPSIGHDVMVKAIKGWATGKNIGCPDLTQ